MTKLRDTLKILYAEHPTLSDEFIDIEVRDFCGNIFEGLLRLKPSQKTGGEGK